MEVLSIDWGKCSANGAPTLRCAEQIVQLVINWSLIIAVIVALFLIIYAGIKLINSGGDPKSVDSVKKMLTLTLMGLIVIFLSFFIINLIANFTNVKIIRTFRLGSQCSPLTQATDCSTGYYCSSDGTCKKH